MYLLQILLSDLLPSGSRHDGCQVLDLYVLRNDSSVSDAHNQSITTLLQRGDCLPLDWRNGRYAHSHHSHPDCSRGHLRFCEGGRVRMFVDLHQ